MGHLYEMPESAQEPGGSQNQSQEEQRRVQRHPVRKAGRVQAYLLSRSHWRGLQLAF